MIKKTLALSFAALAVAALTSGAWAAAHLRIKAGMDILPFSSNVVTGPYRGQQHCFVCDMEANQPAVLVFSREMDAPMIRLMDRLRAVAEKYHRVKLFPWVVFLGKRGTASEVDLENKAEAFARLHAVDEIAVTALGDPAGPPGYLISPDADVCVLMFRHGRVVSSRAYDAAHWNMAAASHALQNVAGLMRTVARTRKVRLK